MKVFITGASGYVGKATTSALKASGHAVIGLSRTEASDEILSSLGAVPVRGTIEDTDLLFKHAQAADAVVHLAQSHTREAPQIDRAAAEAMLRGIGSGTYVHTGGVWVYGSTAGIVDESAPLNPPGIVAWRPVTEEAVLATASRGQRPVVIQPGLVYGEQGGMIELFFKRPGPEVAYIGDGRNHWPLVHVHDIAALYVCALEAPAGSKYIGVGPVAPTAKEIASALARAAGDPEAMRSLSLEEARSRMGGFCDAFALDQMFSSAKAADELGWITTHIDPIGELEEPAPS